MLLEYISLFILGLIFGSFISSVSWRMANGISFTKGRSVCPKCRKTIKWYNNIPLLSFIVLDGKCRNCKMHISFRYPILELFSGIGFVIIYYFATLQGPTLQGGFGIFTLALELTIFVIFLTIFVIDLENQVIPDSLVYVGIIITLLFLIITNSGNLFAILFPGFVAASFLMFVYLFTKGRGMGLGDVKFAVLGGMIVGLKLLFIWLLLAFLTGGIVGIILILARKAKMKTKIAFGPFLILGLGLALIFGRNIMYLLGLT